jgi:hypothetical protein
MGYVMNHWSMRWLPSIALALSLGGCTMSLNLSPQIPLVNNGPKAPLKVAVIVPQASRDFNQAATFPAGCISLHTGPAPHGQIFLQTVQGILEEYFEQVVILDAPPGPNDAQLTVEAVLTGIGMKTACDVSPEFYAEAKGSFRTLDSQGRETWRDPHGSARVSESMPGDVGPYHSIMPKAMAALVSSWAADLMMSPVVRNAQPQSVTSPSGSRTDTPWWKQSGSDNGKN